MDPLSALGLAGNIITFVDFSWKILAEANSIYKSPTGASEEAAFLEKIVRDVNGHADALAAFPGDGQLRELANETRAIASELLNGLSMLQARTGRSRWKSFVVALKEVWGRDKTESLLKRLQMLQDRINSHLHYITT